MKKVFSKLLGYYRRNFWSLEKQARHAGVKMGKGCRIKCRFWSSEPYLISLGNDVGIANGVKCLTHGGALAARHKMPQFDVFGKVTIGNNVYFGANVLVMPGVTIGDNVLIAGGSVVTKSIPRDAVVGGTPAKYLCSIEDYIERNIPYNTDTYGMDNSEKKKILLSLPDEKFVQKPYMKIDDKRLFDSK